MSPLAEFIDLLLREGHAVLRSRPGLPVDQDPDLLELLRRAYRVHCLGVAGPPIDFEPATAHAAAVLLYHSCWFLVSRGEPDAEVERLVSLPGSPRSVAEHLSADLLLRFLPRIHRRAKALNPADRLTVLLADVLRRWPLSGVMAELDEGPLVPPAFGDHAGLWMLYVERLADHEKSAWVPKAQGLPYLEFVYRELGKDPAALLATAVDTGGQSDG